MSDQDRQSEEWDKILRQAWVNSSFERDKAIVTLSSGGLALIVAFITKVGSRECLFKVLLLAGLLGFAVSAVSAVLGLHLNREIIERELARKAEEKRYIDHYMIWGFMVGVVSVALIGVGMIFSL